MHCASCANRRDSRITAVITLALGIGANTAIFTLVQGILLRSLPVADPSRLYRIGDNDDCCVEGGFPGDASDTGDFTIFSYRPLSVPQASHARVRATGRGAGRAMAVERAPRQCLAQVAARRVCLRQLLLYSRHWRLRGPRVQRQRRYTRRGARNRAQLPGVAGRICRRPFDRRLDDLYSGAALHRRRHRAPRVLRGPRLATLRPISGCPFRPSPTSAVPASILHHEDSHWLYPLGRVRPGTNIGALQAKITVTAAAMAL